MQSTSGTGSGTGIKRSGEAFSSEAKRSWGDSSKSTRPTVYAFYEQQKIESSVEKLNKAHTELSKITEKLRNTPKESIDPKGLADHLLKAYGSAFFLSEPEVAPAFAQLKEKTKEIVSLLSKGDKKTVEASLSAAIENRYSRAAITALNDWNASEKATPPK